MSLRKREGRKRENQPEAEEERREVFSVREGEMFILDFEGDSDRNVETKNWSSEQVFAKDSILRSTWRALRSGIPL